MARYADLIPKRRIVSQRKLFDYHKYVSIKDFVERRKQNAYATTISHTPTSLLLKYGL